MMERYKDPRETLLEKLEPGVKKDPRFGPITLHLRDRTVWVGDNNYEQLSDTEYRILWILLRADGKVVSPDEMEQFINEEKPEDKKLPQQDPIRVHITHLRNKLKKLGAQRVEIVNVHGRGYYLKLNEDPASEA